MLGYEQFTYFYWKILTKRKVSYGYLILIIDLFFSWYKYNFFFFFNIEKMLRFFQAYLFSDCKCCTSGILGRLKE